MRFQSIPGILLCVALAAVAIPAQADITDKTYFVRYMYRYLTDSASYRQEKPYQTPTQLMRPDIIATKIAQNVDPATFLRGASTSEHQCSQECTPEICSWSRFAKEHNLPQPNTPHGMNLWKYYRQYFDYAADTLHLNALRFSIEWALVQPNGPESWDQKALDHYADQFVYAIKKGIAPIVCFHHYTDPNWFLDRGGFEKEDNVSYYVQYCQKVYEHILQRVSTDQDAQQALATLGKRSPLWATFNAPDGYAFRGYRQKQGPPSDAQRSGLGIVATVLKNTLEGHVGVYHALKKSHKRNGYYGSKPLVGILKNVHQIDPAKDTWAHYCAAPFTRFIAGVADMIQNGSVYKFFIDGEFRVHVPFMLDIKHVNKRAQGALDFIGLNYYSNRHMYLTQTIEPTDSDLCTDNAIYYHYPEGMYRAIHELNEKIVNPFKARGKEIPVIVAENGIATKNDQKRRRFYHEYLYAIYQAVKDGVAVQGYLPWTLASNYEWPSIKDNKERDYGLCSVDKNDPSKLQIKEGALSYMEFVAQMKKEGDKVNC